MRIGKSCCFFMEYESTGIWEGQGSMQKPHRRQGASAQAMQTQLLNLHKVVSQTFGPHCIQKAIDARRSFVKLCPRRVPLWLHRHGVLEVESRKKEYHGGAYIDISDGAFFFILFSSRYFLRFCLALFFCLKKACLLLHVILLPESQAVKLLQGHAEHLVKVLWR